MIRFIILVVIAVISTGLRASTITTFLELVLAEDGVMIEGNRPITVQLRSSSNDVVWEEVHDARFYKGATVFEIGTKKELKTFYFYDKGTRLIVEVDGSSVDLPMYSTPFSLFSHAADIVNAIHMEGVFHTDLVNERIGIALDVTTPSVRLEVNGALRVSDDVENDEIGVIRWRNNRLEGRHNERWKLLDAGPEDELQSKWSENLPAVQPAFYVEDGVNIKVATTNVQARLTVGGDVFIESTITANGTLTFGDRLNLMNDYGVSLNGQVMMRSLTIDSNNQLSNTNGLVFSGVINGRGDGLTNIQSNSISNDAIQNNELADGALRGNHLKSKVIGHALAERVIHRRHLHPSFKLTNQYLLPLIINNSKLKRHSVLAADLSPNFELSLYVFEDGAIVSRNIGSQNIDHTKIQDGAIKHSHFQTGFIDRTDILAADIFQAENILDDSIIASDFSPQSLTYAHLSGLVPINKGGTNVSSFNQNGGLIVVSDNVMLTNSICSSHKWIRS